MSEKLLNRLHLQWVVRKKGKKPHYQWDKIILLPLWVLTAFIASALLVSAVVWLLSLLGVSVEDALRPAAYNMVTAVTVYVLSIIFAIGIPYRLFHQKTTLREIGLSRPLSWTDIGLAPLTFIAYALLLTTVLGLVIALFPNFPAEQTQDIGFNLFGSRFDNMIAFMTLVVLAPLAEEALFRGYLYGKLKAYVPAIWGAVATSLLFGVVHFQWNVGVDVFVLSMFLCGLRSLTGSIWAGVLTHSIKNAIAYFILINPLFGG